MIDQDNLARKDFSEVLPDIKCKLVAISEALRYGFNPDCVDDVDLEVLRGFGCYLSETANDINAIDKSLYWKDEPEDATDG